MLEYTGERAIPWHPKAAGLMKLHAMRYAWAVRFATGRTVIDLGCGAGYGSYMLSWVADLVIGLDRDPVAIAYARSKFWVPDRCEFACVDLLEGPIPEGDLYVAFEVLEHLDDPQALLQRLKPGAAILWSVPMLDQSVWHKQIYNEQEAHRVFPGHPWCQWRDGTITPGHVRAGKYPHNALGVGAVGCE